MVRRRRRLARLCLGWAALSLVSELTPLGHRLDAAPPAHWYAVTWLAAGAPGAGFAVLLGALSSGLRRGRAVAFWLFAACLALAGPLGSLARSAVGGWLPLARVPAWFWLAVAIHIGLLGVLAGQRRAFRIPGVRSPRRAPARTDDDEARLRGLIAEHGSRDSLSYFALRHDKGVIFSPTGKAAICYRVLGGVSLAAGDPLGDPEAWRGAITAWAEQAEQHGWRCAVLGAGEQAAVAYQRFAGLHVLTLGDEAVLEVTGFDLGGRAMRCVRQAHARVARAGYTATAARQHQLDPGTLGLIARAVARWRGGSAERGFSMALGRIGQPGDPDYLLLQCHDRDNQLRAVLGFAPWGPWGLSLDLMSRDRQADNGLIEYLIVELAARAPALGVDRVSLNFAMFRDVFATGARIGASPVLRAHRRLLLLASRWWQLESLYRANMKYQPSWVPRYLCFAAGDLVPVLAAAGRAEGFLP